MDIYDLCLDESKEPRIVVFYHFTKALCTNTNDSIRGCLVASLAAPLIIKDLGCMRYLLTTVLSRCLLLPW